MFQIVFSATRYYRIKAELNSFISFDVDLLSGEAELRKAFRTRHFALSRQASLFAYEKL